MRLLNCRCSGYPRGMGKKLPRAIAHARRLWELRDDPEALKHAAAKLLGPHIPSQLRMIPDPFDDYAEEGEEGETKLAVPFYCQMDWYSCGAIAAWAVVETFHPKANFNRFYRDCDPDPTEGTSETKIVRALRKHGVGVGIRRDLDFDSIAEVIENGFPIIAGVGHEFSDGDHWVVIYGYSRRPKRVFLSNIVRPGCSHEEYSWREFRSEWSPRGHGLICWGK